VGSFAAVKFFQDLLVRALVFMLKTISEKHSVFTIIGLILKITSLVIFLHRRAFLKVPRLH